MAMHWLDQVRYADTNGYHSDETRSVSPYRDYVIQAFNDNLPYDRFTIEQLAGDLLPNATLEQQVASGFNRMNQLTAEGGAQSMEYRAKYNADRVRAMGSVWMGATLGCAECHDHKFDPYTAKDFYSFAAFFADLEEYEVYTTGETWAPLLPLPTPEEKERLGFLEERVRKLEDEIRSCRDSLASPQQAWEEALGARLQDLARGWQPVRPLRFVSEAGATLSWLGDYSILAGGKNPERDTYILSIPTDLAHITGIRLEFLSHPSLNGGLGRAGRAPLELSEFEVEVRARGEKEAHSVKIAEAEDDRKFYGAGAGLTIDGTTSSRWMLKAAKPSGDRVQAIYKFAEPVAGGPGTTLTVRMIQHGLNKRITVGHFRLSLTMAPKPTLGSVGVPEEVQWIVSRAQGYLSQIPQMPQMPRGLQAPQASRTPEDDEILFRYYRAVAPELEETRRKITQAHDEILELKRSILTTLPSVRTEPRVTRILRRGNWQDESGEIVEAAVPAFLSPLKVVGRRGNRLDLARWLGQLHGEPMPDSMIRGQQLAQLQGQDLLAMGPNFSFARYGKSGQEISELFPHIAQPLPRGAVPLPGRSRPLRQEPRRRVPGDSARHHRRGALPGQALKRCCG